MSQPHPTWLPDIWENEQCKGDKLRCEDNQWRWLGDDEGVILKKTLLLLFLNFFFLVSTLVWARQAFYHLSHDSSPWWVFFVRLFFYCAGCTLWHLQNLLLLYWKKFENWQSGLSGRAPALQMQSPEYHHKKS
jgi:hypothetical protein